MILCRRVVMVGLEGRTSDKHVGTSALCEIGVNFGLSEVRSCSPVMYVSVYGVRPPRWTSQPFRFRKSLPFSGRMTLRRYLAL